MIALAMLAALQLDSAAVAPTPAPPRTPATAPTVMANAPRIAAGLGSCSDPWGTSAGQRGPAHRVHPDVLRERFAVSVVQHAWPTVVAGYGAQIDSALMSPGPGTSTAFAKARDAFRPALRQVTTEMLQVLLLPNSAWAERLASIEINQFRPQNNARNELTFLQSSSNAFGTPIDTAAMSIDERRIICWSSWSMNRLLQNINFETIPGALINIEAQTRRWERYRTDGPMQLPHELVVNRLKRAVVPATGSNRFNPPRWDLVAVHPFAAVEMTRVDGRFRRSESLAVELVGATLWINDWRQHIGGSFVMAYDADGRLGRGVVARAGGYATAGVLQRRAADGISRTSVLLVIDALRLLKPDAATQALRQTQGVAGEILGSVKP